MLCVLVRFPLILRCSNISQETRDFDKLSTFKIPSLLVLPCTEWKWGLRSIYTHGIFKLGLSTYSNYHGTEGFLRRQWQGSGASLLGIPLTWGSVEMESHSFHKLALSGEVLQVPDANTQTEGKMRLPASLGQLSWTLLVVWVFTPVPPPISHLGHSPPLGWLHLGPSCHDNVRSWEDCAFLYGVLLLSRSQQF